MSTGFSLVALGSWWIDYARHRALKALDPLASCDRGIDRYSQQGMKALGPLAVAERDIRALRTARADSRPLRRLQ
jgi:hypothetical protein